MSKPTHSLGRLVYLMGPSGAGKDSVIQYARSRVDPARVLIAHRFITRRNDIGGENHVSLSEAEFSARKEAGLFALSWRSHGLSYGIGLELRLWLAQSFTVLVSGSRESWGQARAIDPKAIGILVTAAPEIRRARLTARSRENSAEIRVRLERTVAIAMDQVHVIDNNGLLDAAAETLVCILQRCRFQCGLVG